MKTDKKIEIKRKMMNSIDWEDEWKTMGVEKQKKVVSDHLDWILEMVTPNTEVQKQVQDKINEMIEVLNKLQSTNTQVEKEGKE